MAQAFKRDEAARLAALDQYDIVDTAPEDPFERITDLVRSTTGVPIATITLVDAHRQWFKARRGIGDTEAPREISFCQYTIQSPEPLIVTDAAKDPRVCDNPFVTGAPGIASYCGIPLVTRDGFALGALCAIDTSPRIFSAEQVAIMKNLAGMAVDWLEMRRMAHCDFLTGVLTRRALLGEIDKEITRYRRYGRPCAVAIFDIDHFKSVNDTYGHATGDELLVAVANICQSILRSGDLFGRLGGEEFGLLLPETEPDEALAAAERFRQAIAEIELASLPDRKATASFGVAAFSSKFESAEAWLCAADQELYRAKRDGRDRCYLRT